MKCLTKNLQIRNMKFITFNKYEISQDVPSIYTYTCPYSQYIFSTPRILNCSGIYPNFISSG